MDVLRELVGDSPKIASLRNQVVALLRRQHGMRRLPPILIQGETGTGKGLLARLIHRAGPRASGPFVDVNCAAIPDTLLEAELFGFERGAFTDARRSKPGLFQTAHRGTIFLDEIALLPEILQAKLLKVIEEQIVRRLGSTAGEPVDVAILTATNENIVEAVRARRFREDLYHRLAVLTVELPPLRERRGDIVPLAEHFLVRTCAEYGLAHKSLAPDAKATLSNYPWPGNVRELMNVIERASLLAEGPILTAAAFQLSGDTPTPPELRTAATQPDVLIRSSVAAVEERLIQQTLDETDWNVSQAAARLGLARNTLKARIRKYGLQPGSPPATEAPVVSSTPSPATEPPARAGVQWEWRRLALLRVMLTMAADDLPVESSRAFDMVIEKARAFSGRVVEVGTAGITVAFGLEPIEDAPRWAALAAMAMRKAVLRDDGEIPSLVLRAAIHAVQVPVARVGTEANIEEKVRRDVWSVLEALGTIAEPEAIVVSQPTMSLLTRRFGFIGMGASETAAGPVYQLTDYRSDPFDVGGRIGRFVGRDIELDLLRSRLSAAQQGHGQLVVLVGEAGMGKSRLLYEFRRSLADEPVVYLEGRCASYGSATPYLPILEMLRAICRIAESDSADVAATKIRVALAEVATDPAQSAPYLLHLLGIEGALAGMATPTPDVIKRRTFEALRTLVLRHSLRVPLVLAVEDLHWVDQTSEEFLASLAERITGARILLIATFRSGYRPSRIEKSSATQIALQPLAPQDSLTIVQVVLGAEEVAGPVAQLIVAKAEGNPFFLEELARAARAQGPTSPTLTAPDTVREVILARIDQLPPDEKRLLQAAAVIGKDFVLELLRAIADWPGETARSALRHLQTAEFIYETSPLRQPEYCFTHALTHEVAYDSLADRDRKRLHRRVLTTMEQVWPDTRAEHAEVLADHARRAEVWDSAVDYLRMAGTKAWTRGALAEAISRYEDALVIVQQVPASDDMARRSIDVRLDLHAPLMTVGRTDKLAELYPEAERLARALDDPGRLGQILQRMSQVAWLGGRYRGGAEYAQQALSIGDASGDAVVRMHATYFLGLHRHALGDYRTAIACFARLVEGPDARIASGLIAVTIPMEITGWCWLALASAWIGDFARADASLQRAVAAAEKSTLPQAPVIARTIEALVMAYAGRPEAGLETLRSAVELCERIGFFVWLAAAASTLGLVLARLGQPAAALPYLERGVQINEKTGVKSYHAQRHAWWAEGLLRAGRLEDARVHADTAVELAHTMEERGTEAEALLVRAMIARTQAVESEGRAWFDRLIAVSAGIGARPFEAHGYRGLGGLLARVGDAVEARRHFEKADLMFREMRLTPWWPEG